MTASPILTVLDGIHSGAKMYLGEGDTPIGSGTECAVVIADPAIQQRHFEILVQGSQTSLRALRPLHLSDGTALTAGDETVIAMPTIFSAGATRFLLDVSSPLAVVANDAPASRTISASSKSWIAPAAIGSSLAAFIAGSAVWFAGGFGHPHRDPSATEISSIAPVHGNIVAPEVAATALRQRLREAKLGGVVITEMPDGTLSAGGILAPGDQPAWGAVRQWFDARYGSSLVVIEDFAASGSMPPLKLAAVWNGSDPYVVDESGSRLHVGASVGGGWMIEAIGPDRVKVRREGQHVELRY